MPRRTLYDIVAIFALFFATRIIYSSFGISFQTDILGFGVQFIDPELLKNRLLESIFYLHSQPPMFNLFLGIILKVFPQNYPIVFEFIYSCIGITFFISIYLLMVNLGVNNRIGLLLVFTFMVNPAVILYEHWLFYTYPIACLLCLTALFLNQYLKEKRKRDLILFFTVSGVLVLTRSLFHYYWYILFLGILLVVDRSRWKSIVKVSVIPLIFILSVCLKNFILYKTFGMTTDSKGYQISAMILENIPEEELIDLIEKKKVSQITILEAMDYMSKGVVTRKKLHAKITTGIPLLDNTHKASGGVNYNNIYNVASEKQYEIDMKYLFKNYPQSYSKSVQRSLMLYFFPGPSDVMFFNRIHIDEYEMLYNFMFLHLNKINSYGLYFRDLLSADRFDHITWDSLSRFLFGCVVVFYVSLFVFGLIRLWRMYCVKPVNLASFVTLFFICFNIFYVTLICTVFCVFASNRYRFTIDAFYLVLLGLMLTKGIEMISQKIKPKRGLK